MEHCRRIFLIIGCPPERNKTIVLRVLQNQDSTETALSTYWANTDRDVLPQEQDWIIRAIPLYPVEKLDRAVAQFYIDAGEPPGPGVINPLVRAFRESVSNGFQSMAPLSSKWGRRNP